MTKTAWIDIYCAVVLADGLLSLVENVFREVPTELVSIATTLLSLPVLVQSLRGRIAPARLLALTAGMEVAAFLVALVVSLARVHVPRQLLIVGTYVPIGMLGYAGLTRNEPGRPTRPTLARVSLLWALASATVVAALFPGGTYAITHLAAVAALCGSLLGLVAVFTARSGRERLYAAVGCGFNYVVAVVWSGVMF